MTSNHVFETPPQGVARDWTMPQEWARFSAFQHRTWDKLVSRHIEAIGTRACRSFLAGLDVLELHKPGIPDLSVLNPRLLAATGWTIVPVPGVIPNNVFFRHLAARRFPAANFLRSAKSLDYSDEPDMFHDLFGHVPMLADPVFANFMVAYGNAGLRSETLGAVDFLGRLYLHTVEFGLVVENGELRGFGAGLLSSYAETVHAVTASGVRRLRFDLERVMRTDYIFDDFQKTYFVIDSFEHLLRAAEDTDFRPIYSRLRNLPLLAPDAECEGDAAFVAGTVASEA